MPAILKNFLPNEFALITKYTSFEPYAIVGSNWPLRGHRVQDRADAALQHYILATVLIVYAEQPVDSDTARRYDQDV